MGRMRKAADRVQAKSAGPEEAGVAFLTDGPKFKETCVEERKASGTTGDPG